MENEMAFQLKECINIMKKGKWVILIITFLFTLAGVMYSVYIHKTVYQASTSLIAVNSVVDKNESQINDIMNYQNITSTYSEIATSTIVAEKASENLKGNISPDKIQSSIMVTTEDKTPMLIIAAQGRSPAQALKIANAVTDAFKEKSLKIYSSIKFQTVNKAELPQVPISSRKLHSIIIAFLIGLLISIFTVFLMDYLDITIKSEKDIQKYLGLPVIGNISKYNI